MERERSDLEEKLTAWAEHLTDQTFHEPREHRGQVFYDTFADIAPPGSAEAWRRWATWYVMERYHQYRRVEERVNLGECERLAVRDSYFMLLRAANSG